MSPLSILLASLVIGVPQSDSHHNLEAKWRREYPLAIKAWDTTTDNFLAEGQGRRI